MIEKVVLNGEEHSLSPEYKDIRNKPSINGVELKEGNNTIELVNINIDPNVDITGEGETPTVINTGTPKNPTLKFKLPKGEQGDTGKTYVPSISETGDLSWSLEENPKEEESSTNIRGPQGERGRGLDVNYSKSGKTTTVNITTDETIPKLLKSFQISDGNDGHNPCLGRFTSKPSPMPTGQVGDYIYVDTVQEETTTTEIYHYTSNGWDENGTEVDISNEEFNSGEHINSVRIDDTQLDNPTSNALAKAEDVMPLAAKLKGVTAYKDKAPYTPISGYKVDGAGGPVPLELASYATIYLGDATSVEFRGVNLYSESTTLTKNSGYCFGHYDGEEIEDNWVIDAPFTYEATSPSESTLVVIEKAIPQGSTHLRTNVIYSKINTGNFFCYKCGGKTVMELVPQIVDNLYTNEADKALSARQGKEIYDALSEVIDIDYEDYTRIPQYITSNNVWSSVNTTFNGCYIIPLNDIAKVYIKAKSDINAQYAFLTSQSHGIEIAIDTVPGDAGGRKTLSKGTEISIEVPAAAKYIYIAYSTSSGDVGNYGGRLPEKMQLITPYAKINKDDKVIADSVVNVEIKPFELDKSISTSTGNWISTASGSPLYHYQVPVCGGEHFRITPSATSGYLRYAFLSEIGTTAPTYSSGGLVIINLTTEGNRVPIDIVIPDSTKFLYIQAGTTAPSCIQIGLSLTIVRDWDAMMNKDTNLAMIDWLHTVDGDGYDIVKSLQVLNALKKADQLRHIEFTPNKNSIPAKTTNLSADIKRKSVPYSSNNDDLKLVGIQVSLHTFMTAINNPYSLMYTERCNSDNSKSAWGKVYSSNNAWSYYGTVCCGLTSSVYGCEYKVHNGVIGRPYRDFGDYIPLAPEGEVNWNNLQVGDIGNRYESVHSFMIYKLKRDGNGAITNVTIIESASTITASATGNGSGGIRTQTYTKAQFESFMNGTYIHTLYRYVKAYKNTNYEQSPFVTLTDYGEIAGDSFAYNNEICTFAGDKASFAKGDLVVLNYNLDGNHPATTIKVYKDDVLIDTKTVEQANATYSDYASLSANGFNDIDQTNHVLVLGTELAPGKYKACINNSENYTYWEVLDTDVTIVKVDDDTYKLFFNDEPSVVYFPCFTESGALKTYVLKEADIYEKHHKSMIIHPKSQYTLSLYNSYPYEGKIRVAIKGEYGIATGAVVELEPTE